VSDSSGASGDELPPEAVLISSRIVSSPDDASRQGTLVNSDNEDQEEITEDQKRCVRHARKKRGPAKAAAKPTAAAPMADHHPMAARSQAKASRAGSLRDGGGSGATDTCAAQSSHSGT
jgi:hypothetical protein